MQSLIKKKIKGDPYYYMESYIEKHPWRNYICPECGAQKSICMQKEYVYKIETKYYCSYTCWRKALKETPQKERRNFVNF